MGCFRQKIFGKKKNHPRVFAVTPKKNAPPKNIQLLGVNRPSKRSGKEKQKTPTFRKNFMVPTQAALQLQEFLQPLPLLQTHGLSLKKNVSFKQQTPGLKRRGVFFPQTNL